MNRIFKTDESVCRVVGVKEITCDLKNFFIGEHVTLNVDGKKMTRRVYDNKKCGLYVRINNTMVCYYDFN